MDNETAKAVQEVAKTTSNAIDAAKSTGGFIAEFIREPLKERVGILTDNLKYKRWENQQELRVKAIEKLAALGQDARLRQIPMNVGVPLLEAASLESDDDMQTRWANLLVNFADDGSGVTIHKAYVTVLEELTPLEVVILDKIYSLSDTDRRGVMTANLPDAAEFEPAAEAGKEHVEPPQPRADVMLALSNLFRLGCLSAPMAWDGGEFVNVVYKTIFGREFVKACKVREPKAQ